MQWRLDGFELIIYASYLSVKVGRIRFFEHRTVQVDSRCLIDYHGVVSSSPSSSLEREASTPSCSSRSGVTLSFEFSVQAKLTKSALNWLAFSYPCI